MKGFSSFKKTLPYFLSLIQLTLTLRNSSKSAPNPDIKENYYSNSSIQTSLNFPSSISNSPVVSNDYSLSEQLAQLSGTPSSQLLTTSSNQTFSGGSFVSSVNDSVNSNSTKRRMSRKEYCRQTMVFLDKCLSRIPPIPDIGIPSTPHAVDKACKAFNMGMTCVDDWTKRCLPKEKVAKFKASISGAHETFTFLCRDHVFRQEFLTHGDCYRRISPKWDECSKQFIDNMRRFHTESSNIQCCVRLSFLQCVGEISHYHCNREAAKFLQKMAETLIRATMRNHVPPQCVAIHLRNCSVVSGEEKSRKISNFPAILILLFSLLTF